LVTGVRGPGGGYQLSRKTSQIDIGEIIEAVDEVIDATKCGGKGDCQNGEPCLTHELWLDLSRQIREYLGGISLQNMLDRHKTRKVAERQDRQTLQPEAHRIEQRLAS